ncbi:hypothetical protein THAOC_31309, partial [Thalassiosira oceanica]
MEAMAASHSSMGKDVHCDCTREENGGSAGPTTLGEVCCRREERNVMSGIPVQVSSVEKPSEARDAGPNRNKSKAVWKPEPAALNIEQHAIGTTDFGYPVASDNETKSQNSCEDNDAKDEASAQAEELSDPAIATDPTDRWPVSESASNKSVRTASEQLAAAINRTEARTLPMPPSNKLDSSRPPYIMNPHVAQSLSKTPPIETSPYFSHKQGEGDQ